VSKLSLAYLLSIVVIAALAVSIVVLHVSPGEAVSEVQSQQLIERQNEWILQFDVTNRAVAVKDYTITVFVNELSSHIERFTLADGKKFAFVYHLYRDRLPAGENRLGYVLNEDGVSQPLESFTYNLR